MAIFTRNKSTLNTQLANKATDLRVKQDRDAEAAKSFISAADQARADSALAAQQAAAVEQAVAILDDAGVTV